MLRKKEKEEEEQDIKNSVQDKTKSKDKMHDFRRKLLEDRWINLILTALIWRMFK